MKNKTLNFDLDSEIRRNSDNRQAGQERDLAEERCDPYLSKPDCAPWPARPNGDAFSKVEVPQARERAAWSAFRRMDGKALSR